MPANLENSAEATGTKKGQFSFQFQRRIMPKNVQTTAQLHSFHTGKVMLKILQARLQQYVNHELPEIKLPISAGSAKKQESSRKISTSALLNMSKPLTVDYNKLWKILQEMGILDHLT